MDDTMIQMMRLAQKGYSCSQILFLLALEGRGEENPALIRSMAGLAYGCGSGIGSCGVFTGGSCLLAFYASKGRDAEKESERFPLILQEFSDWFSERVGGQYGGIDCNKIVGEEGPGAARQRCGMIVRETYAKVMEILVSNGFEP